MANSEVGTAVAAKTAKTEEELVSVDMVYEILSRVSARSVLRLKSVCKLWRSVAEDHYFIYMQLERSKSKPPQIILHADTRSTVRRDDARQNSITFLSDRWLPKLTLTSPYIDECFNNTRPCNGLICVYDDSTHIRLCNPVTRELQVLPDATTSSTQFCCLGFVPKTKVYKVLRFFPMDPPEGSHHHQVCEVLTVGSSSWRRVGETCCYTKGKGVNLDGSIYLIASMPPSWEVYLMRFDPETEQFDTLKLPDFIEYRKDHAELLDLVLRQGKLCVVKRIHFHRTKLYGFFLRGDYKDNIWDRFYMTMDYEFFCSGWIDSLSFVADEGLLLRQRKKVYMIPRWSHVYYFLDLVYSNCGYVSDVYEFVESLVPLEKSATFVESRVDYYHVSDPTFREISN